MKRPLLYLLLGAGLREHDHADRAVAARTLVPDDEERAVVEVGLGREDLGHLRRQPGVAIQHAITLRAGDVLVHVVAEVRDDEVVARDGVVDEVGQELRVGPHVLEAARRARVQIAGDVVEVHERVVVDVVEVAFVAERAVAAVVRTRAFVLLVGLPRDPGRLEQVYEVAAGALGAPRRVLVAEDAEVRPSLEPEVVGQARGHVGRVVVLLRVRGDRQQRAVDVRGRRAVADARPVGVLHQDEEHRADGRRRPRRRGGRTGPPGRGGGRGRWPRGGRGGGGSRRPRGRGWGPRGRGGGGCRCGGRRGAREAAG